MSKFAKPIEELLKDNHFVSLADDWYTYRDAEIEIHNEIVKLFGDSAVLAAAIDRLLYFKEKFVKADLELDKTRYTVDDVIAVRQYYEKDSKEIAA